MKKFLSLFVCLAVMIPMAVPSFAAAAPDDTDSSYAVEIAGETIVFTDYYIGNTRYIEFVQDGVKRVYSYDQRNLILTVNGMSYTLATTPETPPAPAPSPIQPFRAEGRWVQYGSVDEGNLGSTIGSAADWIAIIAQFLGVPAVGLVAEAANRIADAVGAGKVYYRMWHYYWDPVISSRPKTAYRIRFYSDPDFKNEIASYDTLT